MSAANHAQAETGLARCPWCGDDPLYVAYHDEEWGVPSHDEKHLFEMLILEAAQAGLSWLTILRKRENYRRAFAGFDPHRMARFTEADRHRLLADAGIVRNRLKIDAAINNAQAYLRLVDEAGGLDAYLWGSAGGRPIVNAWARLSDVPPTSPLSERISKDLKQRGFKFVGPTIIYAWLQSVGVVNDHLITCPRYRDLAGGV